MTKCNLLIQKYLPGLYIIATPIGNLKDISMRAIETLKNSSIILCEDTRVTSRLLAKYAIKKTLKTYNDWSTQDERDAILSLIQDGEIISLVSDAGTPLISDPGYKLIRYLQEHNIFIDSIPGPSAVTTALTLSGIPCHQFHFAGFVRNPALKYFMKLKDIKVSLVCFVQPKNIAKIIQAALLALGNREAAVIREISKLYQESRREKLSDLLQYYEKNNIKGEVVLIITAAANSKEDNKIEEIIEILLQYNLATKDIINMILHLNPLMKKSYLYKKVLIAKSRSQATET